ncbi:MAG: hypothetical protein PVH29_06935 [Candidatus Zixiibacteriota bacterium]|jgi:hypothetical protein
MRIVIAVAAAWAVAVGVGTAKDFVNEDFEGTFPPPGWTTFYEGTGDASWSLAYGGPGGRYALGGTSSWEQGLVRATFMSPEFEVKANTRVYYRFDYDHHENGHSGGGADFYITYVQPSQGNLVYVPLESTSDWEERSGDLKNDLNATAKACWRVWTTNYWRYHFSFLMVDGVIISDDARYPGVEPNSLGRVKALFR